MNKRERVLLALGGQRVDRVPFTMWRHFYREGQTAEGLALATLDFYRRYDPDLIVLTPNPFYMVEAWGADVRSFGSDNVAPYLANPVIARPTDWRKLPEVDVTASSLRREVEAIHQLSAQLGAEDAPLIVSLFSPLTTADTLCNGRVIQDLRSFSNDLRSGLQIIAETTRAFALACLDAGADGFLLTSRLASRDKMRIREYRDFGQRFDLDAVSELDRAEIRILHLEGEHLFFDLAGRYPVQALCWETWRADPSLASARRQARCTLMGGINPTSFVSGSVEDVRDQIVDAIAQTEGWGLLVAPSGPLPPNAQDELLASVNRVIQEL